MLTLQLASPDCILQTAGGKGANLARLLQAGYPVPGGFVVTTSAYRSFVTANQLQAQIDSALERVLADDPAALENASQRIRESFLGGNLPAELAVAFQAAYAELNGARVAVRSSATAEDLPGLSFAGQQDTFLNIISADELLQHVVLCWASLWTARAIAYRLRNQIDNADVALAVVVQELVQSDVSGVLFTANPLTGLLSEMVIDATFGLGEALVSGQVEPDHFTLDTRTGVITGRTVGAKQVVTRSSTNGGVTTLPESHPDQSALSDDQIRQLAALGQQVQELFGAPQDIEWAFAGERLWLLQSRPITSLFPVPLTSFDPLVVWMSFGAVQGLLGPITPLGQDSIRQVVAGAGRMFGVHIAPEQATVIMPAGERLWIKMSDVIRHPLGSRMFEGLLEFIEPGAVEILQSLAAEPRLGRGAGRLKFSTLRRIGHFALPFIPRMLSNFMRPERGRARFEEAIAVYLSQAQIVFHEDRFEQLAAVTAFIKERVANAFPFLLPKFIPIFGPSMAMLNLLLKIAGDRRELALEVTRGLPDNVTIEMDLALWQAAKEILADPACNHTFCTTSAEALAGLYLAGGLPPAAQSAVAQFLDRFGMRGVAEIDIGQPRWREDPTPVMHAMQSYLDIPPEAAPDVLFERGRQAAQAAIEELAAMARRQHGGRFKEKLVRFAARRIRTLMGARESPKFFAIRVMGIARQALLEVGRQFVSAGTIAAAPDLFYLQLSELEELSRREARDWQALISSRRSVYQRELRRGQSPRVLVSDGRTFYEGLGSQAQSDGVITGSPVSPGVVEGLVRVVLDPRTTRLSPGEILVCLGTDPAWTPLFMAAGGLITEVGGMMTHGSVVAREFGIPAVVGVHQATRRLHDGQKIRLNGTTGEIVILNDSL